MSLAESAVLEEGLPTSMGKILIIDDEPGICGELEKVLIASGYEACSLSSPEKLHEGLSWGPALILLDIWMPGKDGMEVLQEIQQQPEAPAVIMMSGHASISTAVKATQMGACDFLEKPLDVDTILKKVEAALAPSREDGSSLSGRTSRADEGSSSHEEERHEEHEAGTLQVHQSIFGEQAWKGEAVPQRTLKHSTILYGQGLHSGKKSGITLEPLPANSGLHFVGVSGGVIVPAHVDFVESTGFATTLKVGPSSVQTIEHLLSALHAFGISNLLVKCNEEVPILDGSAIDFCNAIHEVGVQEQDGEWYALCPPKKYTYDNGKERLSIEPAERLSVEYELEYPAPLGKQHFSYLHRDTKGYEEEIGRARTFGFVEDVGYLQAQGLAQGGRMDNFVLYGKDGAINQSLRYPDEAVRHKILDILGDLYLLGRPLQAKITGKMTGHSDNIGLLRLLQKEMKG